MTDHPRFQIANGGSDRCYRQYHGAAVVEGVLRAADWWVGRRSRAPLAAPRPTSDQTAPIRVENAK